VPHSKEIHILNELKALKVQLETTFEKCTGVSQSRLEILNQLFQSEELSQSQLQKTLQIDNAAITRHLKQLEASGRITRRKSDADNRITLVQLTPQARQELASLWDEKVDFVTNMLEGFSSEEIDMTLQLLQRIGANVAKIKADRSL
jgi:DNA-binding MarR family transcriptional regulator